MEIISAYHTHKKMLFGLSATMHAKHLAAGEWPVNNYASILHMAMRQPPRAAAIGRDAYYKRKHELK